MIHFVFWSTKNRKKHQIIMELCKDLGLKRLQRGIFLGKLKREERESLEKNLRKYLTGAVDNFYIIPLCNDCWNKKISKYYEPERKILQPKKPFEIIS
jgi:CRISPR-associated endonuclease Cas2